MLRTIQLGMRPVRDTPQEGRLARPKGTRTQVLPEVAPGGTKLLLSVTSNPSQVGIVMWGPVATMATPTIRVTRPLSVSLVLAVTSTPPIQVQAPLATNRTRATPLLVTTPQALATVALDREVVNPLSDSVSKAPQRRSWATWLAIRTWCPAVRLARLAAIRPVRTTIISLKFVE